MRLGYSEALRSNFLIIDEPFEEREYHALILRAHMHVADRGEGAAKKIAVAYRNSDGSHTDPTWVSSKTLRTRAIRRGADAA